MSGLRILLVEDEIFIALDEQEIVEACGHSVVGIAVAGVQAIAMAEREKPDVVLMDIRLSGDMDGVEAAKQIRDRYGITSVFVTANTDRETRKRADAIAPLAILQKPLDPVQLRRVLADLSNYATDDESAQ